jgi:simple sugar transport system substrate-binding protein
MMRKTLVLALVLTMLASVVLFAGGQQDSASAAGDDAEFEIAMVVKLEGVSWFDDMRRGIEQFDADYPNVNAYQVGHNTGDPAAQIRLVEDLIAKGVDAIIVIPNDVKAMEPVLRRANEAGILTFSHEAASLENVTYDIEAFDNRAFGEAMMRELAANMGGEGKYAQIVGLLTMETHMDWATAAREYQEANFPNMENVTIPPIEDDNNQEISYQRAIELLRRHPDLRGFQGNTGSSAPAFALAVEELGREDFYISGLTLPSMASDYVDRGTIQSIHFWSPADAGYVSMRVAYEVLQGNEIVDGMDLGRPGYESVTVRGSVVYGNAPITATTANIGDYDF